MHALLPVEDRIAAPALLHVCMMTWIVAYPDLREKKQSEFRKRIVKNVDDKSTRVQREEILYEYSYLRTQ